MNIDPATVLALVAELYAQNAALAAEVEELREQLAIANGSQ